MRRRRAILLLCCLFISVGYQTGVGQPPTTAEPAPQIKKTPTDALGDPLPRPAMARLGTTRMRVNFVSKLVLSPDGKFLAGGNGGEIRLWEVSSGKSVCKISTG